MFTVVKLKIYYLCFWLSLINGIDCQMIWCNACTICRLTQKLLNLWPILKSIQACLRIGNLLLMLKLERKRKGIEQNSFLLFIVMGYLLPIDYAIFLVKFAMQFYQIRFHFFCYHSRMISLDNSFLDLIVWPFWYHLLWFQSCGRHILFSCLTRLCFQLSIAR